MSLRSSMTASLLALGLCSCLGACQGGSPDPQPKAQVDGPQPKIDRSPDASAPGPSPHAARPVAPPPAPLGPPRDVTPSGETRVEVVEGLKMAVPSEWTRNPGATDMRKAEFVLPGPGGDVQLVVYRFPNGAGTADANIDRWKGQVELAKDTEAKTDEREVGELKITSVDARGRFAGQAMPGVPPQPPVEDARLFAAAIMGSGDPFYFKLVGPAKTVDVWEAAWIELLDSLAHEA